jgi:arylsulfatase A-like enzyme
VALLGALLALAVPGQLSCRPARSTPPRVVVLVSIDTLRADHVGAYGYSRATTPNLDAFAKEGTVFEDAMSPSPWTLPAHASLLTGLYPGRHGVVTHESRLPASVSTLAEAMGKSGFITAAVVNSHRLSPHYGLQKGFWKFRYVAEEAGQREPGSAITDQAVHWLKRYAGERVFLFVHYYDVHSDYASRPEFEELFLRPYEGPADGTTRGLRAHRTGELRYGAADAERLVDLYDAGIRQMDHELSRLFAAIQAHAGASGALVMVTSDHGEEFLERGGVLHGRTQFQEMLHVPLVVHGPGVPRGRRIETPVSLVDVPPTLLRLAGIEPPSGLDGEDLSNLLGPAPPAHLSRRALFAAADHQDDRFDERHAVRRGSFKLHADRAMRETRLFDLDADPGEERDLSAERPDVRRDLGAHLARYGELARPSASATGAISPEDRARLESLGYLQ